MEGETRRRRKPLSDRTNTTFPLPNPNKSTTRSSLPKLPPPTTRSPADKKHQLIHNTSETHNKRSRKSTQPTHDANKENVDRTNNTFPDPSSPPSTPSLPQPLSPLDEPLTVYARRQRARSKGKEKVVSEAFTCLPVDRKRNESRTTSFLNASKSHTDPSKKRRIKEHVVSKDYIEQQRAYFAEIDRCELPEEEVSESELSEH